MLQVKKIQFKNAQTKSMDWTFRQVNVMNLNENAVAKSMAAGGTYSIGETTGVLKDFGTHIAQLLANNNSIKIEGLGTFEISTKSGSAVNKEDLKKSSIKLGINFTPSADILETISKAEIKVVQTATVEVEEENTPTPPTPGDEDDSVVD